MYTRPRILIVDHNVDNCEMLPIWLDRNQNQYEITTTYSAREARELTIKRRFDVYVLDYLMPDMTGADLAKTIRAMDPNAPIIIYTGLATDEARTDCIRSGADLFFVKPNDMDLLSPTIDTLLSYRVKQVVPKRPQRIRPGSIL